MADSAAQRAGAGKHAQGTGRTERNWRAPTSIREQHEYCWRPKSAETHTSSCCAGRALIDQQCLRERERAVVHSVRTMRCMVMYSPATPDASEAARDGQRRCPERLLRFGALLRADSTFRHLGARRHSQRRGGQASRARGRNSAPVVLSASAGPGALPGSISAQRTGQRALVVCRLGIAAAPSGRPVKPRGRRRLLSIVGETVYNRWPRLFGYKTQMGRSPGNAQGRLFFFWIQ